MVSSFVSLLLAAGWPLQMVIMCDLFFCRSEFGIREDAADEGH